MKKHMESKDSSITFSEFFLCTRHSSCIFSFSSHKSPLDAIVLPPSRKIRGSETVSYLPVAAHSMRDQRIQDQT